MVFDMKRNILFVMPGPIYEIKSEKYKILSRFFDGTIITTSDVEYIINSDKLYNFKLKCIRIKPKTSILFANIEFFYQVIRYCLKMRKQKEKIDLVVTYDPLKTGAIGALCAKILGTKFAPEVNGVYTSPAVYLDIKNSVVAKIKRIAFPLLEAFVLSMADGVNILFPDQIAPFKKILKGKNIQCFPCFVDVDHFVNKQHVYIERNEILFVGFPFKLKGVDILIKAFKKLSDKYPDWTLKILGWYPDKTELNAHINGHSRIFHHPPVLRSEMPEHIQSCSIFVLPSRTEAMGRVLVESMASGKPVIGSNVDGIPNVISDGIDGLIFESENVDSLVDKLETLMSDVDLRIKLGSCGSKKALSKYSSEAYYHNLFKFYTCVITKGCN